MRCAKIVAVYFCLAVLIVGGLPAVAGKAPQGTDFTQLVQSPAAIQKTLERCDGHPDFEMALANWLETTQPGTATERAAVRETSLRLLEDTTDRQIVLGLLDGLLRHAIEDLQINPAIVPSDSARTLFKDIRKYVKNQRSKANMILIVTRWVAEDGSAKSARQAAFIQDFLKLASPHR